MSYSNISHWHQFRKTCCDTTPGTGSRISRPPRIRAALEPSLIAAGVFSRWVRRDGPRHAGLAGSAAYAVAKKRRLPVDSRSRGSRAFYATIVVATNWIASTRAMTRIRRCFWLQYQCGCGVPVMAIMMLMTSRRISGPWCSDDGALFGCATSLSWPLVVAMVGPVRFELKALAAPSLTDASASYLFAWPNCSPACRKPPECARQQATAPTTT